MIAEEAPQELYVVTQDGEIVSREPSLTLALERIEELERQLLDLERERRGERARMRLLLARIEENRANYPRHEEVQEIFAAWRSWCGHPRARLTNDRFDAIRALLEVTKPRPYTREHFALAIAGAAYDPFVTRRKNGTSQRHDDAALIFRDGKTFEGFIKRAPKEGE